MAKTAYSPMELWRGRVGSEVYAVQNGKQVIRNYSPTKGNPQALADWRKRNLLAFVNVDNKPITLSIWKNSDAAPTLRLQYSKNGIQWHEWGLTSTTELTVQIQTGSRVYVRGIGNTATGAYHEGDTEVNLTATNCNQINADGLFACEGELYKLLDAKNNNTTPLNDYAFTCLFKDSNITIPPSLSSINIASDCYNELFYNSHNLLFSPVLPATQIPRFAYARMCAECANLSIQNKISAQNIEQGGLYGAFINTKIKETNHAEIKTLEISSFQNTYTNCVNLEKINDFKIEILSNYALYNCFSGCSSLKNPPQIEAIALGASALSRTFFNCTNLTETPIIRAEIIDNHSELLEAFKNCIKLSKVTVFIKNAGATTATTNWLSNVAETGKFYTPADADWGDERSPSLIPEGWERIDI